MCKNRKFQAPSMCIKIEIAILRTIYLNILICGYIQPQTLHTTIASRYLS